MGNFCGPDWHRSAEEVENEKKLVEMLTTKPMGFGHLENEVKCFDSRQLAMWGRMKPLSIAMLQRHWESVERIAPLIDLNKARYFQWEEDGICCKGMRHRETW